ncbi:MAG TPA: thiamine-phosphate kinase [Spirochaetota bacterium]|nr:thiamine-phosphate kinase [Spirochaetota bacterium]
MPISKNALSTLTSATAEIMQSEWDIIKNIKERVGVRPSQDSPIFGIGDDCAVYRISDGRYGLFSTDISIENVHFDLRYTSFHDAGYRSMSANISDIYAMGGTPVLALVALGLPSSMTQTDVDEIYRGILASSSNHQTFIAGGDISASDKLVISISIYGETTMPVYRSGAKPGDYIYLTGKPGLSKLGLELLQSGKDAGRYPLSIKKHLTPDPRGGITAGITKEFAPSAMIDISDGLISDIRHVCEESGTGFIIDTDLIPVPEEIRIFCRGEMNKVLDYSLYSGEEYELLFTSSKPESGHDEITLIGRITETGYFLKTGDSSEEIVIAGYDHFQR